MKNNLQSSPLTQELVKNIQDFLKRNSFHLSLLFSKEKILEYNISRKNDLTSHRTIEQILTNKSRCKKTSDQDYIAYRDLFKQELKDNYPDELFIHFYKINKNYDYSSIFGNSEFTIRYFTHPSVTQEVNIDNLKQYLNLFSRDESLIAFVKSLRQLPYWEEKDQLLKNFLLNGNFQPVYQKIYDQEISCIVEKPILQTFTCDINFSILSQNDKFSCRHTFSKMNAFFCEAIKDFHSYRPENCLIEGILFSHIAPKENYKKMVFVTQDSLYGKAFAQIFIEKLQIILKESPVVSEKSDTGIKKNMTKILEETQVLFLKMKLENDLVHHPSSKVNKL